jgi:hypothetical protein
MSYVGRDVPRFNSPAELRPSDDVSAAFSVAKPTTETMTAGYQRPGSWEPNAATFLYNWPRPQNGQNY